MERLRFSANLGFLWTDRPLPDAIRAAKTAGFDAVECHWPFGVPARDLRAALDQTGLPMLGLNTARGRDGETGLSALPGRESEARTAIEEALAYARAVGAASVHVMAGVAEGALARRAFMDALRFGLDRDGGITLLIEPLNRHDAPGYFLRTTDQARGIIEDLGSDRVRLMFDCYHVGRTEGDVITRFRSLLPLIGHVQFAGVPARGRPDEGELNYAAIFEAIRAAGWERPLGAEYRPEGSTEESLGWLKMFAGA